MNIKKTAVAGTGTMGSQIGMVLAHGGFEVTMYDIDVARTEWARKNIDALLNKQLSKGQLDAQQVEKIKISMQFSTVEKDLSDADLVVEAVFENLETKQKMFRRFDELCKKETILATNTSTLRVSDIAKATKRPSHCIGTHFLIPAFLTPLVEVSRCAETSQQTYKTVEEALKLCGKDVVTSKDSPGFIINRLYIPFLNEAFIALEEGLASADDIDKACVKGLGHPVGPLKATDASGLDVVLNCIQTLHHELGEKYKPSALLEKLVKEGKLGRKSGKGVYEYK